MTLYTDLGVEPDATPAQIAAAHRAAAKRTHPDTGGDREQFEKVQRAALILRDPAKRERYDQTGDAGDQPDNSMAEMTEIMTSAFDRAMQQDGWQHRDVIAQMKGIIDHDIAQQKQQQTAAEHAKGIAKKALKRLKFKGKGFNPIGSVLEERIRNVDQTLLAMAARIATLKRAKALAGDYDWTQDQRPPQDMYFVDRVDRFNTMTR